MNICDYNEWVANYKRQHVLVKFINENFHPRALGDMCFLGQQVIEKAMKSYLVLCEFDGNFRHHDLYNLSLAIHDLVGEEVFDKEQRKALDHISRFAVKGRYPLEYDCTEGDVALALRYCDLVVGKMEALCKEYIYKERPVADRINAAQKQVEGQNYDGEGKEKDDGLEI